eukprot:CAMPEP_0182912944 /NCGR_PEP_ID=MMETSP0034_2-20130328/37778_1 /TAXON_ID=156128 /ORGANISM="Nephroselmis pyriformis, Strain CCMP717" /LENGTH=296 /DNA_ID=CAMNT_0025049641 /DNA_START=304 /DNA_END=1190 /DNA_ORIENTATION=+
MPAEAQIKCGAWTGEEDKRLRELQSKLGNRWSAVAAQLPGRTGQQCAQRWRHKVNPFIRKDKWTPEEDALLADLYAKYGNRWAEIARRCNGRTDQQCMGRWRRHLDPDIKRDQWEAQEDSGLRKLVREYGSQWSKIAKELTGRTAQQCRARWFQIQGGSDRSPCTSDASEFRKSSASNSSGSGCTVVPPTPGMAGGEGKSKSPASVLKGLASPGSDSDSPCDDDDSISLSSDFDAAISGGSDDDEGPCNRMLWDFGDHEAANDDADDDLDMDIKPAVFAPSPRPGRAARAAARSAA